MVVLINVSWPFGFGPEKTHFWILTGVDSVFQLPWYTREINGSLGFEILFGAIFGDKCVVPNLFWGGSHTGLAYILEPKGSFWGVHHKSAVFGFGGPRWFILPGFTPFSLGLLLGPRFFLALSV